METILIPTDFSEPANNAVKYGVELAKYFDAKLVFVNAYPIPPANYESGTSFDLLNNLKAASEEALDNLKSNYPEHRIECFSEMGYPYDVIENAASKYNADLIVMGIIGEAGGIEKVIGSNAIHVARNLKVPCFIIPEGISYHRIHRIAFACDYSSVEESTLIYVAKCFANLFDAELEIVNVDNEEKNSRKLETEKYIDEKLHTVKHTITVVNDATISDGVTNYLSKHPADVLMVNPKTHHLFYHLFNENVTKELAFKAKLPLLTIH
jgi:nucleotide-binding universal stress UspA family protein